MRCQVCTEVWRNCAPCWPTGASDHSKKTKWLGCL